MRTNVVIDDQLISEALETMGLKTKKAVIQRNIPRTSRLQKFT